jgi:hypothetical protein
VPNSDQKLRHLSIKVTYVGSRIWCTILEICTKRVGSYELLPLRANINNCTEIFTLVKVRICQLFRVAVMPAAKTFADLSSNR